jgi:hypothetical protein
MAELVDRPGEPFSDLPLLSDFELAAVGLYLAVSEEGAGQDGQPAEALEQGGPRVVLELAPAVAHLPLGLSGNVAQVGLRGVRYGQPGDTYPDQPYTDQATKRRRHPTGPRGHSARHACSWLPLLGHSPP